MKKLIVVLLLSVSAFAGVVRFAAKEGKSAVKLSAHGAKKAAKVAARVLY